MVKRPDWGTVCQPDFLGTRYGRTATPQKVLRHSVRTASNGYLRKNPAVGAGIQARGNVTIMGDDGTDVGCGGKESTTDLRELCQIRRRMQRPGSVQILLHLGNVCVLYKMLVLDLVENVCTMTFHVLRRQLVCYDPVITQRLDVGMNDVEERLSIDAVMDLDVTHYLAGPAGQENQLKWSSAGT
ncbi:hypothetical protein BC628DRAFT_1339260 [Trametes gibbosa]|nr:hypothetical protein BC628DRAFT_1339260 [Trametes gibbosa]